MMVRFDQSLRAVERDGVGVRSVRRGDHLARRGDRLAGTAIDVTLSDGGSNEFEIVLDGEVTAW
jgi:hypothetical protein